MCRTTLREQSFFTLADGFDPQQSITSLRKPTNTGVWVTCHQLRYFHAASETCAKSAFDNIGMVRSTEYSDINSQILVFPAPVPSSHGLPFANVQNTGHLARILTSKYSESPATRPATHRVLGKSARVPRSTAQWLSPRCIMKVSRLP